jgi:hypothetical protein
VEDILEDLLLGDAEMRIEVVGMRADVYDPVHVQVQIVKLRDLYKGRIYVNILA